MKRFLAVLCCICITVAVIPFSVSASGLTADCVITGSTTAVITVNENVTAAYEEGSSLADVNVSGKNVTVTGNGIGIANIVVQCASGSIRINIPIGYTVFSFDGNSVTVFPGQDTNYEITGIGMAIDEVTLVPNVNSDGYEVYSNTSDSKICVNIKKKGGTYVFCGHGNDGAIAINKEATADAQLLLAGLELSSSFTSPITIKKDSTAKVTITALEGYTNSLSDEEYNNADIYGEINTEYAESSVIKAKTAAQLTINGKGCLKLECNTKNAIKVGAAGSLVIKEVMLDISSSGHGISSENTLEIQSGAITVDAAADAIRSNPDIVDASTGYAGTVKISGGDFVLKAGSDGIFASQDIFISGGTFDIQTGAGFNDSSFDENSMSCKGIKTSSDAEDTSSSTNTIEITGGEFVLNTADDALHSDAYIVITGGKFTLSTGDDAVHADTSLTLGTSGGGQNDVIIKINNSYEGLEAGNIYIYSGSYTVTATDDGINAAGDSSNSSFNPGGGPGRPGGTGGMGSTGNYSINIYGGKIYVNAGSDGFDSNNTINLTGGSIVVWGNSAGGDGEPLDCDGTLTINGATVFGAGSHSMTTRPANSAQAYITSTATINSGKTINVKHNGTTIFNIIAIKNVNYVIYSSPDMTSSSGWTITADNSALIEQVDPCEEGHDYSKPSWEWSDNRETATATFVCGNNAEHTYTVDATVYVERYSITATVEFEGKTHSDTVSLNSSGIYYLCENLNEADALSIDGVIRVVSSDGSEITGFVGTGCEITIGDCVFTVVVTGDVSGDGKVNSTDFMRVKYQYLELYSMDEIETLAADVKADGNINSTDFTRIRRHFLGLFDLFA